ncbi:hypothetical protein HAX54_043535 [Datura stramonium]|uniref:Uncharacterized protein n=1 Tax=Datura stramonium TaxID=4076 RepID=A0ABS8W2W3_DATST|nr:hypothetical protein [Datura stramonium]
MSIVCAQPPQDWGAYACSHDPLALHEVYRRVITSRPWSDCTSKGSLPPRTTQMQMDRPSPPTRLCCLALRKVWKVQKDAGPRSFLGCCGTLNDVKVQHG